ncbi:MAG: diacylglycerol kinase family protein [Bacteroidales bacterium]|nr:diacylglycerol kinase family lipid kinase [Bacteroidales bacterium]MDZ4204689.1 diacylglycerol kinase family protein [Bacteroidales bacterium]
MADEKHNPEWFIIVNPNAGRRKGDKDWPLITKILTAADIRFQSVFTQHRMHALRLARKYVEMGYKNIMVVGGDGTLNEVVNGIFTQKKYPTNSITIGMISVGTGNDWGRTFGIPHGYQEAVNVIKKGKTFLQDVGWVKFMQSGLEKNRFFANMAGMGYDAMVAEKTNKQKDAGKAGPLSYFVNIFTSLFSFKESNTEIFVDDIGVLKAPIFTMVVGICNYNGGGMMQLPKAVPDDGNLDMTVITKLSRFSVVKNVRKLYDGSFISLPQVRMFRGKSFLIESNPPIYMEADGESLGHSPFKFGLIPLALQVIVGKDMRITVPANVHAPALTE